MYGAVKVLAAAALLATGVLRLGDGLYIPAKAWLAQQLIRHAWAQTPVHAPAVMPPWPWADTGPVARLTIPDADVDLFVLAGGSGRTLAFGPGHLTGSAQPGEPGNAVIAGHRDTHFAFLEQTRPGGEIFVEMPDSSIYRYVVDAVQIVDSRTHRLVLESDVPTLTLVTCYPFAAARAGGPLRYVVSASLDRLPTDLPGARGRQR